MERIPAEDWVLAMLLLAGGSVKGKTRIHKGIFLVYKEVDEEVTPEFEPMNYGPWSREVEAAINRLQREGLITVEEVPGGDESPALKLSLTPEGRRRAEEALEKLKKHPEYKRIKLRLEFAATVPLTRLLAYVYLLYPSYTTQSRIKDKVKSWMPF